MADDNSDFSIRLQAIMKALQNDPEAKKQFDSEECPCGQDHATDDPEKDAKLKALHFKLKPQNPPQQ